MLRNYFKIALRNLKKSKAYSFINISGLAAGMAVAVLIGLWVWDELSFDKYHKNYDRIAQVWQFVKFDVEKSSYNSMPVPLAEELRTKYPDFKTVSVATYNRDASLVSGNKKLIKTGMYTEASFPEMMTVNMIEGARTGLNDMSNIMLSQSLAKAMFGNESPVNQVIRIENKADVKVAGVYEDFPANSSFRDVNYLASWQLFVSINPYGKSAVQAWDENSFQLFAELKPGADFAKVSAKIKDIRMKRENPPSYKPEFFLHPMSKWHLQGDFKDGRNTGGLITIVWLFGTAGVFVLLLACINFMNLSTARSEKRAKEVGIRKTVGSGRGQLISQFFSESVLVSFIALIFSLLLVQLALPFFNEIANKDMSIPWLSPIFWIIILGFNLITGLVAGSYPALYLSSFKPIKVLKGSFKAGQFASLPRKVLVVFQFTVSIILIIGTVVVFGQINHAKERSTGYSRERLLEVAMNSPEFAGHYDAIRTDLLNTGVVDNAAQLEGSITSDDGGLTAVNWKGKAENTIPLLMRNFITYDFGNTIGWKILEGRDFSRQFSTDSSGLIINSAAAKLMGFKDPLSETVKIAGKDFKVIAVVGNIIKDDPFKAIRPTLFLLRKEGNVSSIRIKANADIRDALKKVEAVFAKYSPAAPFNYYFVDESYAQKFSTEVRLGKLAGFFAALAIFISCLGLFGLASFVAEQRTKEIGIRKVLGASVLNVWRLLSKDFVLLVFISMLIASPVAWYFMKQWLQNYEYRISISWLVFAGTAVVAILITLATVSFQAIKAAIANPVKSLRTE